VTEQYLIVEPGDAWLKIESIWGMLLEIGLHRIYPQFHGPDGTLATVLVKGHYNDQDTWVPPRAYRLRAEELPLPPGVDAAAPLAGEQQ
jgi:hypothetical protein